MPVRLYAVLGNGKTPEAPPGVELLSVRDLTAAVEMIEAPRDEAQPEVARYRAVVDALFAGEAVLPAPIGTTFRTADALKKWMDLHYVALADALSWVAHRVAVRVHVTADDARAATVEEVMRQLAGRAVATVNLPGSDDAGYHAAYLVEREVWPAFAASVAGLKQRHPSLRAEVTGPWPPYDFVRLQFTA